MNNWISVSKRLPDESGEYLVYCYHDIEPGKFVALCAYNHIDKEWLDYIGVTHWQPLPEPPSE